MTSNAQYSLLTIIEAVGLFTFRNQAQIDNIILRLSLEDHIPTGTELSNQHKTNRIIEFAKKNLTHQTVTGANLLDEIVKEAGKLVPEIISSTWSDSSHHVTFLRALGRDGFMLTAEGEIRENPSQ